MKRYPGYGSTLKSLLPRLTKPARSKRGFHQERLLLEWPAIVGPHLASRCLPQKLSHDRHGERGGVLHLVCEPAWAMEIDYMRPQMLERIAMFFGFKAVESIVIHQAPLPQRPQPAKTAPQPDVPVSAATQAMLDGVEDAELKARLQSLAATLAASETLEPGG